MLKRTCMQLFAFVLAVVLVFGMLPPAVVSAAEQTTAESTDEGSVNTYSDFLANLKVLEGYADSYGAANSIDAKKLVLNFLRTGVDRYNDDNWKTLAGEEITGFTTYVAEQDAANSTTAMYLRNIEFFTIPNGQQVDFGHMFGTMNIAYVNSGSADLGGWAGDICDLVLYSKEYGCVPEGTVDEMAAYILENCFGVDADDAFGMDDFYGDLDAYYLSKQLQSGSTLSAAIESYFTASLTDADRAEFFMKNRFSKLLTNEDVRKAVYETYAADLGVQILEAKRELSDETDLRQASCYAFADYLFDLAGDRLEGDTGDDDDDDSGNEGGETGGEDDTEMDNEYYSIFSSTSSVLAPGIEQTINYATTADGKQIVYYVATVDVNRDDVTIMANYRDNDPSKGWGMQRVQDQAEALVAAHSDPTDTENYIENFTAVVATNGDGYNMSTGEPGGLLVMEGVEWHAVDGDGFFAILKDGTAMIGTKADYETYKDQIQEGIGAFGATLVKDGEISVNKSSNYYTTRASRTAIGITAEGKVVMMVLDGRQEPFSAGGSMEEIAQIMLDAGCVQAVNLDGGGSTTYLSKPEGSDDLQLVNRPSDGYARSVATSLVAVSTAKSSKEFDHANISSEYDYLTIGTSLTMTAAGVSNTGNAAALPEGTTWKVSDTTIGSITEDGVFTAIDNGEVEVQLTVDGTVVGSKTLYVVVPDAIAFEKTSMSVIFGVPTKLPVITYYNGNTVAFNENDVEFALTNENAGTFDGVVFTADEETGIRSVTVVAFLMMSEDAYGMMDLTMYKDGEAVFDFENATAGNRQLAWDREVSNSTTQDEVVYHITDVDETMDITYVFALDMESIEIPEQLKSLTYMLPGADTGATAWDFLLSLAERVSVLTEVKIVAQFDPNLDVDISELTVVNDYFYQKSVTLDENNTLTLVCGWIDQTAAIDPDTANPICILSGIKATPKDGASWDANNQLPITNSGEVSYKIYLRASSLYSFANIASNQATYGLYPYSSEEVLYNGGPEKGAYFGTTYASFEDNFTLDKTNRQGWYKIGDYYYYYEDNQYVTGVHYVPSLEDASVKLAYEFEEDGVCNGTYTGLYVVDDVPYYAVQGEKKYGWRSVYDAATGESYFYYFHPYKQGAAVNGACNVEGYNYVFEDYKCMSGELVANENGIRYRFAGNWQRNQWIELDGKYYFIKRDYYLATDGLQYVRTIDGSATMYHLFDENGVWQQDYSGLYHVGDDTYLIENGIRLDEPGLVYLDGYYYYFCSTGKAVKNRTYWPTKTNGLLPMGPYIFDEQGRITNPPVTEPDEPDTPINPEEPEVKDGLIKENGAIYYYKDGAIQYCAGLIMVDGDYYYIRSNGQAAIGNYWVTTNNGLLPVGMYTFGADGKMVTDSDDSDDDTTETPEVKDGFVSEYGAIYYYKDGAVQYCAGLIYVDGYYYYVRSNGQVAVGSYWPTVTNDLMPQGLYEFDEQGRMLNPPTGGTEEPDEPDTPTQPEVLNGIVEKNGVLYYYVDGAIAYGAGILKLTDENGVDFYIYVRSNGQLAIGNYWPTTTNDLLPGNRMYTFGTDGRLYL